MKNIAILLSSITGMLLVTVLSSCTSIFFDQPQPVNSKNLKQIPEELQGKWSSPKDYDDSIIIDKNTFSRIDNEYYIIPDYKTDTSVVFTLEDNKIYLDGKDTIGYRYILMNDTIKYYEREIFDITLSDSALLRKGQNCYVLNLRKSNFWEIFLIQKKTNGEITIDYPLMEDLKESRKLCNFTIVDSTNKDSIYVHAEFKSKSIERLIREDGQGTLYTLRPDSTCTTLGK